MQPRPDRGFEAKDRREIMKHRMTLAVVAALALALGGCSATYGYRATPPASSLQAQSLRTLDQASQLGSQAE
jgi:hypothetical protein